MKAREMFVDFLNLAWALILGISCLVYFVLGDRLEVALEIVRTLAPLSFFGLIIAVRLKIGMKTRKKRERDGNLIVKIWLTYMDKAKSEFFFYSLPLIVLAIPLISLKSLSYINVIQAGAVLLMSYAWHYFLFNRKGSRQEDGFYIEMEYSDRLKFDAFIFSLPFIVIIVPLIFFESFNNINFAQAIAVFTISTFWQRFIFNKEEI